VRVRNLLIVGILVREAFSFWTGHPFDFEVWVRTGYWVARGFSPYAPLPFAPGVSFADDFGDGNNAAIGYLPFWPILLTGIYGLYSLVGFGDRFVYYFLIKQPIILADVLVAYLLYLYVRRENPDKATGVMVLWLFSPVTVIVSAIWGTFDSMAMLCVMMALLAPPGRLRSAWDGLATFVKSIPLILILPLTYSREGRLRNLLVGVAVPLLPTVAIVYLAGWPVLSGDYNVVSTLANTLHVYSFPLSLWGTWVYLNSLGVVSNGLFYGVMDWGTWLWIPAVVAAGFACSRWFGFDSDRGVVQSCLVILLTFLLVRGQVNEQYSLYLLALLLIETALWVPERMWLFYALTIVVTCAIATNNILMIRFLSPLDPGILRVEAGIIAANNELRNTLLYLEGLAFCALNLWYMAALIKGRRRRGYPS
jgi:Gpi18-like mannosyltransferase